MTVQEAKRIVKAELDARGMAYSKLTARTVSFCDLARASCIFVNVWGWKPDPAWADVERVAKANGFRVDFE